MPVTKIDSVLAFLGQSAIVEPERLQAVVQANRGSGDPQALLRELVQHHSLTAYQAKTILAGQGTELIVGPYIVLDSIGEGGMGRVFQARHPRLDRTVALKVLRTAALGDTEIVERFHREIRAISQLASPHVVRALDAGPAGSSSFLAMEFVDGIDLARLVQEDGPLPVGPACLYIYQAALGLQHIHECGLVHRDIKPPNLLVTPRPGSPTDTSGTVKLLDLGLARFHYRTNKTGKTRLVTALGDSAMLGTPDYLAPEQALDFHTADIRADIYSLGCTLFFLLTGRPPFAGCSLHQKLLRHQQAAPPAIERLCPGIPPALPPIVGRMLAKAPKDRYQVPAEVATALAEVLSACAPIGRPSKRVSDAPKSSSVPTLAGDGTEQSSSGGADRPRHAAYIPTRSRRSANRFLLRWSLVAAAILGLVAWVFVGGKSRTPVAAEGNSTIGASTVETVPTTYESYVVPSGTLGTQAWAGDLGMAFNVNHVIEVTELGAFDNGSQSYLRFGPLSVRLYDRNHHSSPLGSVIFSTSNPGTQVDGSTFLPLPSPLVLPPGFQGMIVASGYNGNNKNGNSTSQTQTWTMNTGGGLISFTGLGFYNGTPGSYPMTGSGGPANRYAAGTFKFRAGAAGGSVTSAARTTHAGQ